MQQPESAGNILGDDGTVGARVHDKAERPLAVERDVDRKMIGGVPVGGDFRGFIGRSAAPGGMFCALASAVGKRRTRRRRSQIAGARTCRAVIRHSSQPARTPV